MHSKLCIIISSEYDESRGNLDRDKHRAWNAEVQRDLNTVKNTLQDHQWVDIRIPADSSQQSMSKIVSDHLAKLKITPPTECHIVLNTHGAAGKKDVSDEAVKMVVSAVSHQRAEITQISALICHGMTALGAKEANEQDLMRPEHAPALREKKATMQILREKLNALSTDIAQNFPIRGFESGYDPEEDEDLIREVLLGHTEPALLVSTQVTAPTSRVEDAQKILDNIEIVRRYKTLKKPHEEETKAYNTATNSLGNTLTHMRNQVVSYLYRDETLEYEYWVLLKTIQIYAENQDPPLTLKSARDFDHIYKKWLKDHKVLSHERIKLLEAHALSLVEAENPQTLQDQAISSKAQSIKTTLAAKYQLQADRANLGHAIASPLSDLTPRINHK